MNLGNLVCDLAGIFRPPERLTVSTAAHKYVYLSDPPKYEGPYLPNETPYMIEPCDLTQSRDHTAVIFCGPAQSGKTAGLILNTLAYHIKCNPMDVIVYHMTQSAARDFTKRRIDRMHRNSRELGAQVAPGQNADNTHDKLYKSGMLLSISWPSISEMSSKPVPVVMFTDYDRMPDDIDGEGAPFVLGQKRTTTFRNLGMTIVDSSPGREVTDVRVKPVGHEAPPCSGVLGLYNQGDRRRWYWQCPECQERFEPSFSLLKWTSQRDDKTELSAYEKSKTVVMGCPHCGSVIYHKQKTTLNRGGVWLRDGETIDREGNRGGLPRFSKTASFWLKGVAAAYITWEDMVVKYVNAEETYQKDGSTKELYATVTQDQAEPWTPRGAESVRLADDLQGRAEDLPEKQVPDDVRCLVACIDVQKNRWEVQVHGIKPAVNAEGEYIDGQYQLVIIDRFPIIKSKRADEDGAMLWVKPASIPEDWDIITESVIKKTYPLEDGTGHMAISMTFCDSGGSKGRSHNRKATGDEDVVSVTSNAYAYWRRLRAAGMHERFLLVKGDPNRSSPRAHLEHPDSARKDRHANARGEIPVLFFNVNSIKDTLSGMLDRETEGSGKVHFPRWLPASFYEELVAEVPTPKGWVKLGSRANEAWDLLAYCVGGCEFRRIPRVLWGQPPAWLAPWPENSLVVTTATAGGSLDRKDPMADRYAALAQQLS